MPEYYSSFGEVAGAAMAHNARMAAGHVDAQAALDAVRAAAAATQPDFALAPPAPQEPTVTDRTPAETLTAAAEKLRTLAAAASTDTDGAPTAAWSTKPCGPAETDGSSRLYGDFLTREDGRRIAWPPLLHGGSQQRLAHMRTRHAAYIAAMDPGVGAALAELLDRHAAYAAVFVQLYEASRGGSPAESEYSAETRAALAVARAILGEAS